MRKLTLLLLIAILAFNYTASAQAFQKGNKNLDIGVGFGIYGTSQKTTTTFNGITITDSESDGAVSTIIPVSFEYGVSDKIGLGVEFAYNNYVINDSDKVVLNKVASVDFGFKMNYHLLSSDKNDLFIGLGVGFSSMSIDYVTSANQFIDGVSGSGIYFSFGLTDRIFFSDNFGILFNLGYRGYNYSKLTADFSSEADQLFTSAGIDYSQNFNWKFNGVHIGTGIAIKF